MGSRHFGDCAPGSLQSTSPPALVSLYQCSSPGFQSSPEGGTPFPTGPMTSTGSKHRTESALGVQVPGAPMHQESKPNIVPAGQQGGRRHLVTLVVRAETVQHGLQQHKLPPREENLGWDLSILLIAALKSCYACFTDKGKRKRLRNYLTEHLQRPGDPNCWAQGTLPLSCLGESFGDFRAIRVRSLSNRGR